ncbi:MAG: hypothetical protein EA341_17665 [Mongoliibacter sp.]|uniref:hypothetical protein n=1 Tax=Mongoliibacter sp. TaxID=2022438 RepID=UPI0012F05823|nr:hypothetical protein [Mongoliibacter sp.]TVP43688.1 MAG: hypothetical protein EA341_17665 [Mongoliibacter sp.]
MQTTNYNASGTSPFFHFGKKKESGVDKGSNRDTPGDEGGAKPPSKKDYEDIQRKRKNKKDRNSGQEVDNEEKDKNRK